MRSVPLALTAVALVALLVPNAHAQPSASAREAVREQSRVAVDWAAVHDADIQRCGLSQLRAGTIERLVAEGHAIVESVDASGIRVGVASAGEGLQIRVQSGELTREQALPATECDSTFVLDVISRIAELVEEVSRARASAEPAELPAANTSTAVLQATEEPSATTQDNAGWIGSLTLGVRVNESPDWLPGVGLGARVRFASGFEAGAIAELGGTLGHGVTVLEGFLGLGCAYLPSGAKVGPFIEVGPLLHLGSSDALSVTELDAALGAGVQISAGYFLAQLAVYGRLRSFQDRDGPDVVHDTGHFGLIARVGGQLGQLSGP